MNAFSIYANLDTRDFEKQYNTLHDSVKHLYDILEQTRRGTMQRIAYLDSGTTRILTIVATIFLPSAFLVSLISMPLNGAPLRRTKNAYWIFLIGIFILFCLLIAIFWRDFVALFTQNNIDRSYMSYP